MKRHSVALLLQPYKKRLMTPDELTQSINGFAEQLIELGSQYPNFRFNVAMPGCTLERIDPLLLSKLRDLYKRNSLEWLLTGYTEPFLSFSPLPLVEENIRYGLGVFSECTGVVPAGYVPPFSNWEPSVLPSLRGLGLDYAVISHAVLPREAQQTCGYWFTSQGSDSMALFPVHSLHPLSAPADIIDWIEKLMSRDERQDIEEKFVAVHYLLPLERESGADPYRWLKYAIAELDKRILHYQPVLLHEERSLQPPVGLQYLPPSLPWDDTRDEREAGNFRNRLHSFDQIGILHRKMLDVWDRIASVKDSRLAAKMKHRLFFLHDINRFLPGRQSGFSFLADRLWTYSRLIDLDKNLSEHERAGGGRIHITDFLRNGNKSIIMSNGSLKAYCDHKNGGHIYELDYGERLINLCAAFNRAPHTPPDIVSPGKTYSSFIDRIYAGPTTAAEIVAGTARDTGTFADGPFEYTVKKSHLGVKMALSRQGAFQHAEKTLPLSIEKIFGLESSEAVFSFVYQCSNHSLAQYHILFATELHLLLPGAADHSARLLGSSKVPAEIGWEPVTLENVTRWSVSDFSAGIRLQFVTAKPLEVYCLPLRGSDGQVDPSCGIKFVLAARVALDRSSSWMLTGSIEFSKIREQRRKPDAL